ncbi:uncharacterized protein LOC114337386 [Diabrotica virgifera virgifera]|uniref:CCHC-type domain-containing protein n=1 Tax=Diabrotica virgifera virgifera TaxID=50390 RepID=A0ABM5JR76_DIAVI|nr:uncharacterized protein LOC114337386 [Diabrotica virgifera virgifera]
MDTNITDTTSTTAGTNTSSSTTTAIVAPATAPVMSTQVSTFQFSVEPFNQTATKWSRWVKRLEGAYKVFKIPEEMKLPYLLHYMGSEAYDTLCDKLAPEVPEDKSYEDTVKLMDNFYNPAPLEIAEIFRFQSKRQAEGESIQEYLHSLQKLAINCNFSTYLKSAIRNQFVFGLQSKRIQARLLETKGLDLDRAVEIAASMETSEKDSNQFSHNNNYNRASINVLNAKAKSSHKNTNTSKFNDNNTVNNHSSSPNNTSTMSNNPNRACYRCGDTSHLADKCNKKHLICNFCKNVGHIQKVCLKAQQNSHRQVNSVNSAQEVLEVNAGNCKDKFFINLKVNGNILNFEIDSGAAVTIINKNIFEKYFPALQLQKSDVKLTTYCKNNLNVLGLVSVEVEHQELKHTLKLYVVDGDGYSLVGREWIHALEINLHQNMETSCRPNTANWGIYSISK